MSKKSTGRLRSRWDTFVSLNPRLNEADKPHSVKQEFAHDVNINTIMAKARNGIDPPRWMTSKTPMYGDFSKVPSNFQDAFDQVSRATDAFYALPVEFRRELGHDPRNLPNAPRELFARFGLLKEKAEALSPDPGAPVDSPEGSHARGTKGKPASPNTSQSGSNKKVSEKPSSLSDSED